MVAHARKAASSVVAETGAGLPTLRDRSSGLLLHITSLPGPHGNGDLGKEARAFVDFLARSGQRWWQMLPVGPVGHGSSPYSAQSAFAGSPLLVDLESLEIPIDEAQFPNGEVDYEAATAFREKHLRRAFDAFRSRPTADQARFRAFIERQAHWLDDYALYAALKRAHDGAGWMTWPDELRLRKPSALARARTEHADEIAYQQFVQMCFAQQWAALRVHCASRGVALIGDIPIFVAHDSADVWQHRELFTIDEEGTSCTAVAGVPPDYFSKTGQRWGNPLYRWARLKKTNYAWWVERFRSSLDRFDAIRLDHFIGFVRYWKVPAEEETAENGKWMKGPGKPLFDAVARALGRKDLPFIAEDLGAVTPAVTRLRRDLRLPGMRLVQFAFGDDPQVAVFRPHNHQRNSIVYTGTHDNDTIVGWFTDPGDGKASTRTPEQTERERRSALTYLGRTSDKGLEVHWEMIRLAMSSVARISILPVQDLLGLGSEARMNSPGQAEGNWRWRLGGGELDAMLARRLHAATEIYGRTEQAKAKMTRKKETSS